MKPFAIAVALLFALCFAGCVSSDIGVLDLKSGRMVHPSHSGVRQIVVSINREKGTFTTLVRDDGRLVMRTFDKQCNRLSECTLPLFTTSYCDTSGFAFSDNLQNLAYATGQAADLILIDVSSGRQVVLQKRFVESGGELPLVKWIGNSTLLTALREYPDTSRAINEIALFDIASRRMKAIYNPIYLSSFDYALSHDQTKLAFFEGNAKHDIYGTIKIINLENGVGEVRLGDGKHLIHAPSWSPDDSELAYVEGTNLKIWSRTNNVTRTIVTFPEDFICSNVVFGEGVVAYSGSRNQMPIRPLVILDSKTGREIRRVSALFNGGIFLVDKHTVVCELGY